MRSDVTRASGPRGRTARGLAPAALLGLVAALAGCGGGSDDSSASRAATPTVRTAPPTSAAPPATRTAPPTTTPPPPTTTPPPSAATPPERVPPLDRVPQAGHGAPDAAAGRIAERWFDDVRAGHPERAAALMADGTRFVNGDAITLVDRAAREEAAASLPCGARPVRTSRAGGGYVVLELRLTALGGTPCGGEGSPVNVAIRVRAGRIDDWVRLDTPAEQQVPNDASA